MTIKITKLTDDELMRRACEFTTGKTSYAQLGTMYQAEHSPIRTQIFWIEVEGVSTFVAKQFARHKIGIEHYIRTGREDRGAKPDSNRHTPIDFAMLANAQSLIAMSHIRLCNKAHKEAVELMKAIKSEMYNVDPALANVLMPKCEYRGGKCYEPTSCGRCPHYKKW